MVARFFFFFVVFKFEFEFELEFACVQAGQMTRPRGLPAAVACFGGLLRCPERAPGHTDWPRYRSHLLGFLV